MRFAPFLPGQNLPSVISCKAAAAAPPVAPPVSLYVESYGLADQNRWRHMRRRRRSDFQVAGLDVEGALIEFDQILGHALENRLAGALDLGPEHLIG